MPTRQQVVDLWNSDDLVALGMHADALRKRLHPEGIVTYTIMRDESLLEHVFKRTDGLDERIQTLESLCRGQEEAAEFQAFRPLVEASASGMEYVKTVALSRLLLDHIPHLQGTWTLFGLKLAQLSLRFGANDLGVVDGNVSEEELRRVIRDAGFVPKQRDALFRTYSIA